MRVLLINPDDVFERQIDFIRKSAIPLAMVGLLNALPDTQLWKRLEREGRLLGEASGNNTTCSLNFKTRKLGIVDGERKEFWRFFTQALVKHHDKLAETLRLASMGYHFRKLNNTYSEPTL